MSLQGGREGGTWFFYRDFTDLFVVFFMMSYQLVCGIVLFHNVDIYILQPVNIKMFALFVERVHESWVGWAI